MTMCQHLLYYCPKRSQNTLKKVKVMRFVCTLKNILKHKSDSDIQFCALTYRNLTRRVSTTFSSTYHFNYFVTSLTVKASHKSNHFIGTVVPLCFSTIFKFNLLNPAIHVQLDYIFTFLFFSQYLLYVYCAIHQFIKWI